MALYSRAFDSSSTAAFFATMVTKLPLHNRVNAFMLATWADACRNPAETKIVALRLLLVCSFVTAAAVCTSILYTTLHHKESTLFESKFDTVAQRALSYVENRFDSMNLGVQSMASIYSQLYPDADDWPNAAWLGFSPTSALIEPLSSLQNMVILPLVRPEQAIAFESSLDEFYQSNPYVEKEKFCPPMFPNISIWSRDFSDPSSMPYRDVTGGTPYSSSTILTPAAQYTQSAFFGPYFGAYNLHSNPYFAGAIDRAIECAGKHNATYASANCGMLSEVLRVPRSTLTNPNPEPQDMVALTVFPIFPSNNQSSLTGLAGGGMSWGRLLVNAVPDLVSEVDCVIETASAVFTFCIYEGVPRLKGIGDLHDTKFSRYGQESSLDTTGVHMTIYPTQTFEDEYVTEEPLAAALMLLGAFLFCAVVFYCYDLLMRREFCRRQAVLDTKRRFVRFISHEIRTPLNTVRLGLKLFDVELSKLAALVNTTALCDLTALVSSTVQSWTQLTQDILTNSESAVEVLNDLLNYDKIEMGTLRLEFALFNFGDLIKRTCSTMQIEAHQKNISLELSMNMSVRTAQRGYSLIGDQARIGQVLRNLISNALKFTPSGGSVALSVGMSGGHAQVPPKTAEQSELFSQHSPSGICRVSVKDSGAGLSPQQLSQICSEGVQFNANELQAGQGSGLGLFISKGIVEQHGGKLTVASEGLGKGVTFAIEIPYYNFVGHQDDAIHCDTCVASAQRGGETTAAASALSSPPSSAKPGSQETSETTQVLHMPECSQPNRVLVVDDSLFNRRMLTRLLASKGYECEQAEDGAQALQVYSDMRARGDYVDAVLMDFEMPVMNGPTATKKLREMGCTALIVGVTGNVLPDEVAFFKLQGADAVLPKPLVLEDFEKLFAQRGNNNGMLSRASSVGSVNSASLLRAISLKSKHSVHPSEFAGTSKIYPSNMESCVEKIENKDSNKIV